MEPYDSPRKPKRRLPVQKLILGGIVVVVAMQAYIIKDQKAERVVRKSGSFQTKVAPALPSVTNNSAKNDSGQNTSNQPVITVIPDEMEDVAAGFRIGGTVVRILVSDGDHVRQGQVMAELDAQPYEKALIGAKEKLKIAIAQDEGRDRLANPNYNAIEMAHSRMGAAQYTYDVAHAELIKYQSQIKPGTTDNILVDDIQNDRDALSAVDAARREVARQEAIGQKMLGVDEYKSAIEIAKNHVLYAEKDLSDTKLIAPDNGFIVGSNIEVGANALPGATMFTIERKKIPDPQP